MSKTILQAFPYVDKAIEPHTETQLNIGLFPGRQLLKKNKRFSAQMEKWPWGPHRTGSV